MNGENNENLKDLLDQAKKAYSELSDTDKEYAPAYNSNNMLQEIRSYWENNNKNLSEDILASINVGLLAAKTLDFDDNFTRYSYLLHHIWDSFLLFLNVPRIIPPSGPEREAYKFYKHQGLDDVAAKDQMYGIDFSRNVDVNYTLVRGCEVAQWRNTTIKQKGGYYTDKGNRPGCLGIYHKEENRKDNTIDVRIEHIYCLQKDIICLKSYAADVDDTWSIKNKKYYVKGGCIQYYNVINENEFILIHSP